MKHLMVFIFFFVLLTGCQSQPAFTDNGNPGQIKAVVFYDDNRNGVMDGGETGAQIEIGISQDISCPASSQDKVTNIQADANGAVIFKDLKPGKYCVNLNGNYNNTTKLTQEVYVSSDLITTVMFGIVKE
jgi:uncharacterized protein (DUF2141 family)